MPALFETVKNSLLDLVGSAVEVFPALLLAIIILLAIPYCVRPTRRFTRTLTERFTSNFSLQLLAVKVATVALWIFGILLACILIFPNLGLGDIIALLGLSSVAVGFAFQDIFKNFLAGILLLINQPFQVGDQIVVESYEGTVESIDIRSTKIRNYQGEQVVVPNSVVFTNSVQVLTENSKRRTDLSIGLDYNTPLAKARHILTKATAEVEGVLDDPAVETDIVGFGGSSIDFVVRYWTRPTQVVVRRSKTEVILALKSACDEAGFNIPYPIRTVYFFDQQNFDDAAAVDDKNGSTSYQQAVET